MLDKVRLLQDWIVLRMRYEGWPGQSQLPPVRDLALQWGVPAPTVVAVLQGLVKRGSLRQNDSRRYEVAGASAPVSAWDTHIANPAVPTQRDPKPDGRASWQSTYSRLRDDLAAGLADPIGRLPARKRMQSDYACNGRTLRRALEGLAEEGLLVRAGRGYRYAQATSFSGSHRRVYLTGYTGPMRSFLDRHHGFVRAAERELQRLGGELRLFMSDRPGDDPRAPGPDDVAGFITLASERPDRSYEWMRFFEAQRRVPLVVIDPPERAKRYSRQMSLCKILPDNRRAGREIAAHLLAGKHRRVAFFSPLALERGWASLRLAGLQEALALSGVPLQVHIAIRNEPLSLHRRLSGIIVHNLNELQRELTVPGRLEKESIQDVLRTAYGLLPSVQAWAMLEVDFASALRRRCSAWVCLHDGVAAVAWSFLKRHGALDKVRLVGFDNSSLAYSLGFSSYDFSYEAMGRWAVQWLVTPGRARTLQRVPGQLMVRDAGQFGQFGMES